MGLWVVSAVKSGEVSLMRGTLDVAGVKVALLIFPPLRTFLKYSVASSGRVSTNKNPPGSCRVGSELAALNAPRRPCTTTDTGRCGVNSHANSIRSAKLSVKRPRTVKFCDRNPEFHSNVHELPSASSLHSVRCLYLTSP